VTLIAKTKMGEPRPDWYRGPLRDNPGAGRYFYTTRLAPLFYLQITKCGCTFVRNLLYYIDHGVMHEDAGRIHSHENEFLKADLIPLPVLHASPFLFAVIRDPIDRFLSLYFDKLVNSDSEADALMRARVAGAARLDLSPDLSLEGHRQNCFKALNWFGRNLDTNSEGKPNPHWQRQSVRLSRVESFDAKLLTLDGLSAQLETLLEPLVPDIARKISAVTTRNQSKKLFTRAEIMTLDLISAVHAVYGEDSIRYEEVRLFRKNQTGAVR